MNTRAIRSSPGFVRRLAVLAIATAAACAEGARPEPAAWRARTDTAGDSVTVTTLSGHVWADTAILVEELSIGQVAGAEPYLFGNVVGVAAHGDHIYVLDEQVPVLRVYDSRGRHVRDIGREGGGPGEFRNPAGVDVGPDGLVFVYDASMGRITVFTDAGERVETRPTRPFNTYDPALTVAHDGTPYVPVLMNPDAAVREWRTAMVGYAEGGAVRDTLAPPAFDYEPPRLPAHGDGTASYNVLPFAPEVVWAMTPDRAIAAGVADAYRFRVRHPDGRTVVIARASWEPVPVLEEEAAWHRRFMVVMNRVVEPGWAWNGPPIPDHKPAYGHLVGDHDGRIWVARPGPGRRLEGGTEDSRDPRDFLFNPLWRDRTLVDVFDADGRYLGPVKVPDGIRFSVPRPDIRGDRVLAVVVDEDGVQRVKQYRLMTQAEHVAMSPPNPKRMEGCDDQTPNLDSSEPHGPRGRPGGPGGPETARDLHRRPDPVVHAHPREPGRAAANAGGPGAGLRDAPGAPGQRLRGRSARRR